MVKIIIGTTPTIKYKFSIVDPPDFSEAIMTNGYIPLIRDALMSASHK